jgi:dihydroorotase
MRIIIKNGLVIDPANSIEAKQDVYVEAKNIVAVGKAPAGFKAQKEIDATGRIVCPGLVDLCARMREPGQEHKTNIAAETKAAASAGITTLCHPPDTQPILDNPAVAELVRQQAEHAGFSTVLPIGALTQKLEGKQISEMASLKDAGCVAVANVYPFENINVLKHAMEYAATFDLTVFLTPMDHWLSLDGCAHAGAVSARNGFPEIPTAAETAAVARDIALIEQTGVRAHFFHLSTARAVQMIARAQYDGHPVSCDVSAHQLFLTEMDLENFNSQCHVIPPLRTQRDKEGLRAGVGKGTVSAICSDHQPHEPDAKELPFCATEPGISALETLLPLTLKLVEEENITLSQAIERLTVGPAKILGINAGTLSVGARADVCIFDPEAMWQLTDSQMVSLGHNTPFKDWYFKGRVTHTIHHGRLVYGK